MSEEKKPKPEHKYSVTFVSKVGTITIICFKLSPITTIVVFQLSILIEDREAILNPLEAFSHSKIVFRLVKKNPSFTRFKQITYMVLSEIWLSLPYT